MVKIVPPCVWQLAPQGVSEEFLKIGPVYGNVLLFQASVFLVIATVCSQYQK